MFEIKNREADKSGNTPESTLWQQRGGTARDNVYKELGTVNVAREQADQSAETLTQQFGQMLSTGTRETDAQFERAIEICTGALTPDAP